MIKSEGQKSTQALMKIYNALQNTNSASGKERILRRHKNNPLLKMTLYFLLNPEIKTGITRSKLKKKAEEDVQEIVDGMNDRIIILLTYLYENSSGCGIDIAVCQQFYERYDDATQEFIISLITKTLKPSITIRNTNNVWDSF